MFSCGNLPGRKFRFASLPSAPGDRDTSRRLTVFGNAGNVTVLERPFRPDTLVNTLEVALRSRLRQYQVRDLVRALGESETRYRELATSLETQVKLRTAALEETNKELEAFTYTIAHDLRAPLRAQESFSSALLVEFGDVLGETGRDYAKRISHSALRLNELVQDLLEFSRLSRAEIKIGIVDLRRVVLRACEEMQFAINEANAQVDIQPFSSTICGHEATLEIVITNLLSNAIKFCKRDVHPHIRICAEDRDDFVRLTVEDNGIGIAPEHYDQVFGIFNRLHKVGEYPGNRHWPRHCQTSRSERMSGRVGVESRRGVGTRFWIELQKVAAL